jgi:hypothetical protein
MLALLIVTTLKNTGILLLLNFSKNRFKSQALNRLITEARSPLGRLSLRKKRLILPALIVNFLQ